jgi:phage gpG-like protein
MARGFSTSLEVKGLDDAVRVLRRVENLGEDPTPLLYIAASVLEASVLKRFDTGRGPGGVPWAQTKRQVRSAVGAHGPNKAKILVDTGDLRDSIRSEVRPGEVEVGSDGLKNPVKALANQFGSHRQTVVVKHLRTINSAFGIPLPQPKTFTVRPHGMRTNLPARPFIGFDEQDKQDLGEAFVDHLKGLLHG